MTRYTPAIITAAIICVLGFGGFFILKATAPKPEQADELPLGLSVFTERIERRDLSLHVEAQGNVRPQREITVAPQISGRIAYVSPDFIDGGFIQAGQVLVRLEAADYELGVVRARAGVASAQQLLAREEAEAEIARQDLENLGIEDSSPLARREPQLLEAQANLASARAQLSDAKLALERTEIVAPFTGRVREKNVDAGQFVAAGQSLGRVFATDVVEVSLPISDQEMGRLGIPIAFGETDAVPGPKVTFSAQVGGVERQWIGRVTRSAAAVNSQTRLINVIAELEDPFGKGADDGAPMAPGMFVDARIDGTTLKDVLVAPRGAVRSGNRLFVGDPETGTLRLYDVDIVFADPDGAWFRSDEVKEGALGVISPVQAPFDGMSIRVLERQPDGTIVNHSATTEPVEDGGVAAGAKTAAARGAEGGVK